MTEQERPHDDEAFVQEEEEDAAAEAGAIGGRRPDYDVDDDTDDEAHRPLEEAGEGDAEGFELAEHDLIEEASHGEEGRYPGEDAFPDEEESDAAYGEADEEEQPDL
jgi:hypothetical protein